MSWCMEEVVVDRCDPIDDHDMNMIRWENQRDSDEQEYLYEQACHAVGILPWEVEMVFDYPSKKE